MLSVRVATGLNNHGQVIGSFTDAQGRVSSFLYQKRHIDQLEFTRGSSVRLAASRPPWTSMIAAKFLVSACKNGSSCGQLLLSPDALLSLPAVPGTRNLRMLLAGLGLLGCSSRRKHQAQ